MEGVATAAARRTRPPGVADGSAIGRDISRGRQQWDLIMNTQLKNAMLMLFAVSTVQATDYYVDGTRGNDSNNGTSWSAAKKTIKNAYNITSDGDTIHVAEGTYGQVSVNQQKRLTIISENGADSTFIDAGNSGRCVGVFMEDWNTPDTNTVFEGFTIQNGCREGAGGGAYGGTFRNCRFIGNKCTKSGGAAYCSTLVQCLVISNVAGNCAGAVYNGIVRGCEIYSNVATNCGGAFYGGLVENCVVAGNSCDRYGGGAYETTLIGCTVFANSASLGAGGTYACAATNTIIWANKVGALVGNWMYGTYGHCVLKPNAAGQGNSSSDPLLYSVENLDGRICVGSPCLDTGCNDFVQSTTDVAGNARIQQGTVDIGAFEGVVDDGGNVMPDAEKTLRVRPGVSSSFSFADGSRVFLFGIAPLSSGDFLETDADGVLRYENSQIIDAEKVLSEDADDLWCQKLTEVNLSVWSGWAQYVGFSNEDDFAGFLRNDPSFAESTNILKWVLGRAQVNYNSYVSWSWASNPSGFLNDLIAGTANADKWSYLQLDWVTPGTTNKIGSHAVTCCGYRLKAGGDGSSPSDLTGMFIIDSDNDKKNGDGGRYAPNTITLIPVEYDSTFGKFFMSYPGGTGMLRFLCFLKARPYLQAEVATSSAPVAVPYSWLSSHGLYNPKGEISPEQIVLQQTGKYSGGKALSVWHDYVAGTDPANLEDTFSATITISNGTPVIAWSPDLQSGRKYVVYGKTNLTDSAWHFPTNSGSRFFKVGVDICDVQCGCGYGVIPNDVLLNTNLYATYKGALSYISPKIVDAEKIEGTDLDDKGCGEAVGANLTIMTGWAQRAGFDNEDDVFREFYTQYGTTNSGAQAVVRFVFGRISGESAADYYSEQGEFTAETFHTIESRLNEGCAVGIKYLHGTPSSHEGNHVVTVWGLCKDPRYLPSDPRHYCAVIISDSDDDKRGYAAAEDAPNRVKVWPVTWNDVESVYEIDDGFLVDCCSLLPCR